MRGQPARNDQVYLWEFERDGNECAVATPDPLTIDGSHAAVAFGLCGADIVYATPAALASHLDSRAWPVVLEDWASAGSGFHVYHSGPRHLRTKLRLLTDLIREIHPLSSRALVRLGIVQLSPVLPATSGAACPKRFVHVDSPKPLR